MARFEKTAFVVEIEDNGLHPESGASIYQSWKAIEREVEMTMQLIGAEYKYLDVVSTGRRPEYDYLIYPDYTMSGEPLIVFHIQELPLVK